MAAIDIEQVIVEKDVLVTRRDTREIRCDIYRPPSGQNKRVAAVHIHGGAFLGGSKDGTRTARPLAALGYVGVSTQYRLAQEAKWPAQIQDVRAAIMWTRTHAAELDVDPDRIAVVGHSAGAVLALIAAGSPRAAAFESPDDPPGASCALAACISFYAPAQYPPRTDGGSHPLLSPGAGAEAYRGVSPLSYVAAGFPPTMLLHGSADLTVPVADSVTLYQALSAAGVPVELHIVEGVTHIFDAHLEFAELSARWIDLFLDRHVANPRTYPSTEPGLR